MGTVAKKKIFISDIHMNDARSLAKPPYGWFVDNIGFLEQFLHDLLVSSEVEEVVIVGDLFDRWVVPADQDPTISFQEICDNHAYKNIIAALQELAKRQMLTYVPGNHDMSFSPADHLETRRFMETCFPKISYLADPALPHGVYESDTLVVEHGNHYGLFNSPDTWDNPDTFIPIGYFITRLLATIECQTGVRLDFHDFLRPFVHRLMIESDYMKNFFIDIAKRAGLGRSDRINMKGIAGFADSSITGIAEYYKDLLKKWPPQERGGINWPMAVLGDIKDLDPAASVVYFLRPELNKNMVIFGHTHIKGFNNTINLEEASRIEAISRFLPSSAIYANCGTWIDSARFCTYLETEEDAGAKRHYVRLRKYPKNEILQEGFVSI